MRRFIFSSADPPPSKASSPVIITAPIFALSSALVIKISCGLAMPETARGGGSTSRRYRPNDSRSGSPVRFAIFASPQRCPAEPLSTFPTTFPTFPQHSHQFGKPSTTLHFAGCPRPHFSIHLGHCICGYLTASSPKSPRFHPSTQYFRHVSNDVAAAHLG